MRIRNFMLWCSPGEASVLGATHHAWSLGLIPGFFNPETNLWISRSDALNPIEDALVWLWVQFSALAGRDPEFAFMLGREISTPTD